MRTPCNCPTAHCSCLQQQNSNLEDPLLNPCRVVKMENQSPALINDVKSDDPDNGQDDSGKKLIEMTMDEYLAFENQPVVVFSNEECHNIYQTLNLFEVVTGVINDAKSKDPELQLWAFSVLRRILTLTGANCLMWEAIIEAKILKRIFYFLDPVELPQFQFEAVGIISLLAEYSKYITVLVDYGAVAWLGDLHDSPIEIVRAKVLKTLANIAKESVTLCEEVIRNVPFEPLLPEFSMACNLKDASWVLRLFCLRQPQLKSDMVKQVLVVIEQNLDSRKEDILVDTCWTLVSLCEVDTSRKQIVINHRVCRKLIELLDHKSPLIGEPALETVAKITGDQMEIEHFIEFGMLPRLVRILLTKYDKNMKNGACKNISNYDDKMRKNVCKTAPEFDKNMKKNACMTISSIANTRGNQNQEEVVGYGFVYVLADLFEISDMDLKMEVAKTISIITSNCTNEAIRLVGEKCVKPLWDMLDCSDKAIISKCLGGLICILKGLESNTEKFTILLKKIKQVHGLKKMHNLIYVDDIVVSNMAKEILGMFGRCIEILRNDFALFFSV